MMNTPKKILVAPLDWGLGHATRCIPIIQRELEQGNEVVVAADGPGAALLRGHFPSLRLIPLKGYNIHYSKRIPLLLTLGFQLPKLLYAITREHRWLENLLQQERFDQVVSDNRYGLYNPRTNCIIITHQLAPQLPSGWTFMQSFVNRFIARRINRFDACWIPDIEGKASISGNLSLNEKVRNTSYIGWLSRFQKTNGQHSNSSVQSYDHIILLSGPEPQRSILEKQLLKEATNKKESALVLRGQPDKDERIYRDGVELRSHAGDEEVRLLLKQAGRITCRSGYSTLMDLLTLGLTAELIPTPGQTEQEYLAERMHELYGWKYRRQEA